MTPSFVEHFLGFWHKSVSQADAALNPRSGHSSVEPWFRLGQRPRSGPHRRSSVLVVLRQALLVDRAREHICRHTCCMHTLISVFLCLYRENGKFIPVSPLPPNPTGSFLFLWLCVYDLYLSSLVVRNMVLWIELSPWRPCVEALAPVWWYLGRWPSGGT